jgi:hypothetical protein
MNPCCANCIHLTYCDLVDEKKLTESYLCRAHELATAPEVAANESVTELFGAWALGFDNQILQSRKTQQFRVSKRRRRHRNG